MKKLAISLALSGFLAQTAVAGVCDYRPSQLIGGTPTTVVAGGAGATAAAGVGLKAARPIGDRPRFFDRGQTRMALT